MASTGTDSQPHKWWILLVLSGTLLMSGMDMTIMNISLPAVARSLSITAAQSVWIVSSYALTAAALLIPAATTSDRIGRKKVLLAGLALFATGSAVGGLASSPAVMLCGRVLLGAGAAAAMATTVILLRVTFVDSRERSTAIGIWTASASLGAALGPAVGGLLVQHFSWRWVFFVNVGIAALTFLGALLFVPESTSSASKRVDLVSVGLCVLGIGGLSCCLQAASATPRVGLCAYVIGGGAMALLVIFTKRQSRLDQPLLDLHLFGSRVFTMSAAVLMVSWGSYTGLIFVLTQHLQLAEGRSPLEAGLALIPLALANSLGAALAPRLQRRIGQRASLTLGFFVAGTAFAAMAIAGPGRGPLPVIGIGIAIGVVITIGTDAMLGSAPPDMAGAAGSIQETAFSLGQDSASESCAP